MLPPGIRPQTNLTPCLATALAMQRSRRNGMGRFSWNRAATRRPAPASCRQPERGIWLYHCQVIRAIGAGVLELRNVFAKEHQGSPAATGRSTQLLASFIILDTSP